MAVLETDGEIITAFGPTGERKLSDATRAAAVRATEDARGWMRGTPPPRSFAVAAKAVATEHLTAAREFMHANRLRSSEFDLAGFHGQTVLHERPEHGRIGRTVQLGDAQRLAQGLGIPVIHDFRTADVAAGGQGAPLAPIYHAALVRHCGLELPVAVLNLGGVGNITLITGDDAQLLAFDTGPANGMIDQLVQARTTLRCDVGGGLAAGGRVDEMALATLLAHPYFSETGPKSLDRFGFSIDPVRLHSVEDACATLTAFAAEAVAMGVAACPVKPKWLIVCGGGRHNPTLMRQISLRSPAPVTTAEELGWRGDAIEAEAFAYLAARSARGLPISFPGTTGVAAPMTGGVRVEP
jgi:anhydro-N-acetylmuramic acid kinase